MNNNVEPPPTSSDEVVNSKDVLSIHFEPNVLPEDTLMSEPSDTSSSSAVTSVSPEEYVKKFTSQRDRLTVIINNLQEENIQLLTTGDFSKMKTNQKALSFTMNALDSAKKLLEVHNDVITTRNASQRASSSINNKYIPSDKLPKFNADPTASALYQLTHREGNRSNAANEPSLDMFLREFERKLRDHNVSIFDHWLQHLEVCFEKSDNNHHHDWFCRYIKKPVVELNQELTWDQAKALLKQKFDLASQTTPLMWIKHLVNFRQDCNESLTSALHRFRLFCVGAKVPLNENPMAISIFVFRLYTTQFQGIVTATVEDFTKPQTSNLTNNTGDTLYAPSSQPNPFNMSWDNFEAILVKKMVNLESSLLYIQESNRKQQIKTSAESSDNAVKKRKFIPSSPPLRPSSSTPSKGKSNSDVPRPYYNNTYNNNNSKYSNNNNNNNNNNRSRASPSSSSTHNNNYSSHRRPYDFLEEMNALKRQGLCTFCKTEPYSIDHANTCSVRRKYDERKKEKTDAASRGQ